MRKLTHEEKETPIPDGTSKISVNIYKLYYEAKLFSTIIISSTSITVQIGPVLPCTSETNIVY